jgi:hypothetical protein
MMLSEVEIEKITSSVSGRRGVVYAIFFGSALKYLSAQSTAMVNSSVICVSYPLVEA